MIPFLRTVPKFSFLVNYKGTFKICLFQYICQISIMFANSPGDWGSIQGRVIPKTQKMVLDAALLNTQHYKGKVEQSREWSSALPYTLLL